MPESKNKALWQRAHRVGGHIDEYGSCIRFKGRDGESPGSLREVKYNLKFYKYFLKIFLYFWKIYFNIFS